MVFDREMEKWFHLRFGDEGFGLGWWMEGWDFGLVLVVGFGGMRHRRKNWEILIGEKGSQKATWGDDLRAGCLGLGFGKLTLTGTLTLAWISRVGHWLLKGRHLGLVAGIGNFRVGQFPCALTLSLHLNSRVGDMPWHPNPTPST